MFRFKPSRTQLAFIALVITLSFTYTASLIEAAGKKAHKNAPMTPAAAAAKRYAEAISASDRVGAMQLDFACLYKMVVRSGKKLTSFPPNADPIYAACWEQVLEAHKSAVAYREPPMNELWPGKGSLVFFREDLSRYAPSTFVMDLLGMSPPAGGVRIEYLESGSLPPGSFKLQEDSPTLAAPATRVLLRIHYKDPLTSPVTYAPGAYRWTNTVQRPRQALKALTVQWIVLTGLKKLGFPSDVAVVNVPVPPVQSPAQPAGPDAAPEPSIPFLVEPSGYVPLSAEWWKPQDASGTLLAAVGRAAQFPDQKDRQAMLNRVLIVDPKQPEALTALSRELYEMLLAAAVSEHKVSVPDATLAARFNELYWDVYAQTSRMDLSLGMEVGGLSKPTPADYLYRLIPAMERLAQVRPDDLENRLRLGTAYRWNNDQLAAIETHEKLLKEIPADRKATRARVLIELAMSRIAKVSWNRSFDDPGIRQADTEAAEAFELTDSPLDKFTAAYTLAYGLAFRPTRDNQAMLEHLQEAQRWYQQLAGASPDSWRYLLANDTLKGVIEADPAFKPLLAIS